MRETENTERIREWTKTYLFDYPTMGFSHMQLAQLAESALGITIDTFEIRDAVLGSLDAEGSVVVGRSGGYEFYYANLERTS